MVLHASGIKQGGVADFPSADSAARGTGGHVGACTDDAWPMVCNQQAAVQLIHKQMKVLSASRLSPACAERCGLSQ
jgi:hypothetical protein